MKPFRFGVAIDATTREELIARARQAEDFGYSTLHAFDHIGSVMAPFTSLAIAAEATKTIRLGSLVFGNDFRHPAMLAWEAATLDVLSGGRLELGLGTGYWKADYEQTGFALEPPGVRVERLTEAVKVIKGFFSGEPFTFEGRFYQTHNLVGAPRPVQQPRPPLVLGGGGKRTLSLAAHEADIVSVNIKTTPDGGFDMHSLSAESAIEKVGWVRELLGERFSQTELNALIIVVEITDNRLAFAQKIHDEWFGALSPQQILESPSCLIGSVDQIVDDMMMRRERYGFSYISIFGEHMQKFAPVVARLSGT
jgi:probable F420-dependent oxidoreductase